MNANQCFNLSPGAQDLIGGFDSSRRPFDGELALVTLWPEVEKVFGHGYEVQFLVNTNSINLASWLWSQ